ncbi:MAG: ABC transporter substrate-binding protein [Mariprofundaceae bacterium]|nr:ABC transporter substrate-binding protein [Mariprofundaceae bacterium]
MITRILFYVFLLAMLACTQSEPAQGLVRVGVAELPITLDPRYATDAASQKVQAFIHRGLTRQDEHFLPQADIASHWLQKNPLTWDFFLRNDVFFHDGRPVLGDDVVATLRSVMDAEQASPLRASFASIKSMEVLDNHHIRLHLSEPDAALLTRLNIGILPQEIARQSQQVRGIVGCGAFVFKSWQKNTILLERKNKKNTTGAVQRIAFIRVKDAVTRSLKLARGEIDMMQNDFPLHMLPYLRQQPGVKIVSTASTTFAYIGINLQDKYLANVQVRHALALGVDRKKLKKALFLDAPVLAETILGKNHWAAAQLPTMAYNPAKAMVLLDNAGFPVRADGWRFHLTYRTSTNPERLRLATAIAAGWRDLNIDVSIESLEWGSFYARIKRGDFQLFSLSWVGISDPDIYRWILHSDMWPPKGANRGRYHNAHVDDWLMAAMHSTSVEQRIDFYRQVQQQMYHDQVYIPLWYEPVIAVMGTRISGFIPQMNGALTPLMNAKLR